MKFEAFEVCFLGLQKEHFLRSYFIQLLSFIKCEKECNLLEIILVQGFCPLKINITQFPNGFHLKTLVKFTNLSHHPKIPSLSHSLFS